MQHNFHLETKTLLTWLCLFMNNYKTGVQMFFKILNNFFQVFIFLKSIFIYAATLFQLV